MRQALIAALLGAFLAGPAMAQGTWSLALGRAVQVGQEGISGDTFLTARHTGKAALPFGLAPDAAAGVSEAGTAFLSVGLSRSFDLGAARLDLRTGPALYRSGIEGADGDELVQFYSSAGLSVPAGRFRIGIDAAHISNAGLNSSSSDTDIFSVTFGTTF